MMPTYLITVMNCMWVYELNRGIDGVCITSMQIDPKMLCCCQFCALILTKVQSFNVYMVGNWTAKKRWPVFWNMCKKNLWWSHAIKIPILKKLESLHCATTKSGAGWFFCGNKFLIRPRMKRIPKIGTRLIACGTDRWVSLFTYKCSQPEPDLFLSRPFCFLANNTVCGVVRSGYW